MGYIGSVPDTAGRRHDWMARMACRDEDPDLFFEPSREHEARIVCVVRCPVRTQCLANVKQAEHGAHYDDRYGVVAGLNGVERWRFDHAAKRHKQDGPLLPVTGPEACGTYVAMLRHLWLEEPMDGVCWSGEVRRDYEHRHQPKQPRPAKA